MKPSENPFRSCAIEKQRYKIASGTLDRLLKIIKTAQYQTAICGPHGTGKSTLLEDIASALRDQGHSVQWHYLNRQMSRNERRAALQKLLRRDEKIIHCLDGGEALGYGQWLCFCWRMRLSKKRVLATTHLPCPLKTVYRTKVDKNLMLDLVQSLAGEYWCESLKVLCLETFSKHKGNCREVFRACYFYCSELKSKY